MRLRIRLRECIDSYEARTGLRLSYSDLAELTGLSVATVQSIGSRGRYNATLEVIDRLCAVLGATPGELLELGPDGDVTPAITDETAAGDADG